MPMKVLVADDSPTVRRRAAATLGEAGYDVTCVEDGEAAWGRLDSGEAADVLLCDVLMPRLDGYELCRRAKGDPRFKDMPVMLLRGTFEPWDQAKAETVGADGFITKPFEPEALVATLKELADELGLGGGGAEPETGATMAIHAFDQTVLSPRPAPPAPPPAPRPEPVIDEPTDDTMDEAAAEAGDVSPLGMDSPLGGDSPLGLPMEDDVSEPAPAGPASGPVSGPFDEPFALGEEPEAEAPVPAAAPAPVEVAAPAPPPAPEPTFAARPAAASAAVATSTTSTRATAGGGLDDADIERLAERVVARISAELVEKIAWEVVPEVAEAMIRKRIIEIESRLAGE